MSLNDVRRQRRSSSRANARGVERRRRAAPRPPTGAAPPASSARRAIRPGAAAASSLSRVTAARSLGVARPFGRDRAVLAAREQQPRERRVARVRRARPPHDRLVARAGERDVGQPQVLAARLEHVLLDVLGERRARRARRRSSARRRWPGRGRTRAPPLAPEPGRLPQVGEVDDRELEPLAAVDRQHLHGLGVGLQPAAALLVARLLLGGGDPLAQPAGQRGRAEPLGGGRRVQQLADVAQVGQPPLAVDLGEQRGRAGPRRA